MNEYRNKPVIFIVDDIPENIQILGNILSKENYQISFSTSGQQALSMIKDLNPDLIMLDIMMPEINGYEVCKKLKESDETKDIPVIFLSAKTEAEDIVKGFQLGAVDYVTKPFNSAELLARANTHIQFKNAREKLEERNKELEESLLHIKRLEGLLPICSNCKKIRLKESDSKIQKNWIQMETYISERTDADFSHGICPECMTELYPELNRQK